MDRPAVILADAFSRSGLAVARALGRHGLDVVAVTRHRANLVTRSRFVTGHLIGPDPVKAKDDYARFVAGVADRHAASLVIPITDAALSSLSRRREHFSPASILAMPAPDAVDAVLDKRAIHRIATSAGVPCPEDYGDLRQPGSKPPVFPVVIKNARPDDTAVERPLPFRVAIARDPQELESLLAQVENSDSDVVFQQFARGRVVNVCLFAVGGRVCCMHGYQSVRRTLHEGIARDIVALSPDIADHSSAIVRALDWTGVAHAQFLVDERDDRPRFMEVNGRFWASTQGSLNIGWNFPAWLYEYHVNGRIPDQPPIPPGERTVYHRDDLLQLVRYWFGGRAPCVEDRGRLATTREVLRDLRPAVKSDVWRRDDPWPAFQDLLDTFRPSKRR